MKWKYIEPDRVDKSIFGFQKLVAVKVAKWHGNHDIRAFSLKGWKTFADLTDTDPITNQRLKCSEWFIYAGKGE
jgi:hypothetical protein